MSNANPNANYSSRNNGGPNRVFPSPKPKGCSILPYDGLVHRDDTLKGDVYSSWADKNQLGTEQKYKYWRTSKLADQNDIWGSCKQENRGGVLYNKKDHSPCNSLSNSDSVTQNKMNQHYDAVNRPAHLNNGSFKSLMGLDLDADGNVRGTKLRDYYTYGTFTASGAFVPASGKGNMAPAGKSCNVDEMRDDYYGWLYQQREKYNPRPGPQKSCNGKDYRYANGSQNDKFPNSGQGSACGLARSYEDHNEQYLKDHYDQFKSGTGTPSQELLNNYRSNFMLLGQGQNGTTDYYSFGGNVNPFKSDDKQRSNNAHIPSNTY